MPAFSPHDLRHRRISLLHLGGTPWARIGEHVGQRNLAVTANTYTHVLVDERDLNYAELIGWALGISSGRYGTAGVALPAASTMTAAICSGTSLGKKKTWPGIVTS